MRQAAQIGSRRALLQAQLAAGVVAWAREILELTYPEIGTALEVNRRTVMRWAQSEHAPSVQHLAKLEDLSELRHLLDAFPAIEEVLQVQRLLAGLPIVIFSRAGK